MEQSFANIDQVRAKIHSAFDSKVRMRAIMTAAEYTKKAFSDIYPHLCQDMTPIMITYLAMMNYHILGNIFPEPSICLQYYMRLVIMRWLSTLQERLLNEPAACRMMHSSGTFCLFAKPYYADYDETILGSDFALDLQPIV
ncbi:hypothetical protein BELL_0412g00040 [Botrytis elliptica]|uniref:Uncharacterized protein n=1 Tax=Botrytis elliptica TaxID=278938 RepID=A0A4Z1JNQ1_9HELO|nr:hypothetical protein BELL_0412g00040 [Botrytis elliptica]